MRASPTSLPARSSLRRRPTRCARSPKAGLRALACAALSLAALLPAGPTAAQSRSKGIRERAAAAWSRGDFDTAETLYNEALEGGGLSRSETLDTYNRLGATRAVLGKRDAALVAFRQAALIDPDFKTPLEAGKKAAVLAESARRQQAAIGRLTLVATFPKKVVPAGKTFDVPVRMDATFAAILAKVAISVTDRLTDRTYTSDQPAGPEMSFMVPAKVVTGQATLQVRLVGLDGRDNELVETEAKVTVDGVKSGPSADLPPPDDRPKRTFWQTPWPYIIGGVTLAAGGGALYYFVLRPSDEVAVTGITVR